MKRILFSLLFLACNCVFAQENMEIKKDAEYIIKSYLFQISFNETAKSDTLFKQFQSYNLAISEVGCIANYDIVFYKIDLSKESLTDGAIKSIFFCSELILAVESNQIVYCLKGSNSNTDLLTFMSIFRKETKYRDIDFQKLDITGYNLKKLFRLLKKWQKLKKKYDLLLPCNDNLKIVVTNCF